MAASSVQRATSVALTGDVRARFESDLGFRFGGRIATRSVDVGDRVAAGQIVATLDAVEQTSDVTAAEAGVQSAEATLKQASSAFERQRTLMTGGYTTQTNFDNATQALTAARAVLASAKAGLGIAKDKLDDTVMRAGASGLVVGREAEAGQVVDAAQPVFTIARDGDRDAVFDVYEALLVAPPDSDAVDVSLVSDPAVKTKGKVREIAPAVDSVKGTVRVKIGLIDPPPQMGLGSVVVGAGQFRPRDVFVLPWSALATDAGAPAVWVVDPITKAARPQRVVIDSHRTQEILLRDGIKAGDLIVTAGVQMLRPGEPVEAVPDDSSSRATSAR